MLDELKRRAGERGQDASKVVLPNWRIHDIRRTCRTLLARAGVREEIAERVLNHSPAPIVGTYNVHSYLDEKRRALEAGAALVKRILAGQVGEVIPIQSKRRRTAVAL